MLKNVTKVVLIFSICLISNLYAGVEKKVVKSGHGDVITTGDTVKVHYVGMLDDGTEFDSSIKRGEPFEFKLGDNRVIKGWEEGIKGLHVGDKVILIISPDYAYGSQGVADIIPPNAILTFEIEVLSKK